MKKTLSVFLALLMLAGCFAVPSFAADADWKYYLENDADAGKGIIMQPGADGTEKNFSWYAPEDAKDACVDVSLKSDMSGAVCYKGRTVTTYQGDKAAKVTVTGLEAGTTYYYTCNAGGESSEVYSFTTASADVFSALYVTDIHIDEQEENPDVIVDTSKRFNDVVRQAKRKAGISYILSAGDQATNGRRTEYTALTATKEIKSTAFATTIGNHDRKSVDYKFFKNVPNEHMGHVNDYQGGDYWFVQGNALFVFIDSNSGSGVDHRDTVKEAVEAHPEAKWRIAVMHHDLYSGAIDSREDELKFMRILYSPIFDEFNIDLVLLGHNHYYSVSNVLYNGKITKEFGRGDTVTNAPGTVYMVSNSLNRPKDGAPTYNGNVAFGLDKKTDRVLYNILTFYPDEIRVKTYDYEENALFASFTLKKTDDFSAQKINSFRKLVQQITSWIGTVYAFFNNMSVYTRLTEKGYDVNFFKVLTNTKPVR